MSNLPPFLTIPWCFDGAAFAPSDPLVLTPEAQSFLQSLQTQLAATSQQPITPFVLTGQSASIGVADLITLATGLYRVSFVGHVTQAAAVSSSLQFSVVTVTETVTCTQTSTAVTTNTTGTVTSPSFTVLCDPSTPLAFSATYASVGAPVMKFSVRVVVEQLS